MYLQNKEFGKWNCYSKGQARKDFWNVWVLWNTRRFLIITRISFIFSSGNDKRRICKLCEGVWPASRNKNEKKQYYQIEKTFVSKSSTNLRAHFPEIVKISNLDFTHLDLILIRKSSSCPLSSSLSISSRLSQISWNTRTYTDLKILYV